jgi:signal transduction histidine kinase
LDLVKSLLNVSRIEMGTFSIEVKNIDLVEIAKNIIEELQPWCIIQKIKIEDKFSDENIKFDGDSQLVRMILQNLLSNAVKYSKENGKVVLEISRKSPKIIIKVIDKGIGIPESQKKSIFAKLFRADNVYEHNTDGTGLGLYIVKSILDHSGGNISFESEENKGSIFTVEFPETGMKKKEGIKNLI